MLLYFRTIHSATAYSLGIGWWRREERVQVSKYVLIVVKYVFIHAFIRRYNRSCGRVGGDEPTHNDDIAFMR